MEDLIKALLIFLKYGNKQCPTSCEHDILYVDNYYGKGNEFRGIVVSVFTIKVFVRLCIVWLYKRE